jgi:hypothetical protein
MEFCLTRGCGFGDPIPIQIGSRPADDDFGPAPPLSGELEPVFADI